MGISIAELLPVIKIFSRTEIAERIIILVYCFVTLLIDVLYRKSTPRVKKIKMKILHWQDNWNFIEKRDKTVGSYAL